MKKGTISSQQGKDNTMPSAAPGQSTANLPDLMTNAGNASPVIDPAFKTDEDEMENSERSDISVHSRFSEDSISSGSSELETFEEYVESNIPSIDAELPAEDEQTAPLDLRKFKATSPVADAGQGASASQPVQQMTAQAIMDKIIDRVLKSEEGSLPGQLASAAELAQFASPQNSAERPQGKRPVQEPASSPGPAVKQRKF